MLLHLRIAFLYCAQALKMSMEYRLDFFVECLSSLAMQATKVLTVQLMFEHFHAMREWNRYEVFFIYGFSLLPMALFSAFAMNFYQFSDKYLVGGEMDRLLMRPLSSLFQLVMEGIAFDFIADLLLGVLVVAYAWPHIGLTLTPLLVLKLVAFVLGAWCVLTGIFLSLISISFWSQDRLSFLPPVYNLMNFAQFPISIFRPFVQILLTWVIPFGFAAFYPASGFLARGESFSSYSIASPFVGLAALGIGALVWRAGIRHYSGAGN